MNTIVKTNYTLPNGIRVMRSVLPQEPIGFNQWAMELGVSSSYETPREEPHPMRMLRESSIKKDLVDWNIFRIFTK